MKKMWIVTVLMLILSGCGGEPTLETLGDACGQQPVFTPQSITFAVPEDAAAQVMKNENAKLYFCDGYEIAVQTLKAGDLNSTFASVTGYPMDALTVIETEINDHRRYEAAWIAAGEGGDQVGRTVILDDGQFHYCLSLTAHAQEAGSLQESWQAIANSVALQS